MKTLSVYTFFLILLCNATSYLYSSWAEETLQKMSLREKIGQLFMVATTANLSSQEEAYIESFLACPYTMDHGYIENLIKNYHIGGIIFLFKGTPEQNIALMNRFQQQSTYPLFLGQDCEWGLSMRLYNTLSFPQAMTLGAITDQSLLYECGKEIGRQCKAMGVHINFAPVADINSNHENPVIGTRSFGENKERVADCAMLVMQGMCDAGIIACAKHFPGHGDTDVDSHVSLPIIKHSVDRIKKCELYPFKKLIECRVPAIMNAHLSVPALDDTPNLPSSLSPKVVTDILKNNFGFKGLIFTDGMGMQAITNHYEPGQAELMAVLAGNDIVLCPVDVPKAVDFIEQALDQGMLNQKELDGRVLKILQAKEQLLLHQNNSIDEKKALEEINSSYANALKSKLFEQAITLVKNDKNIVPIKSEFYNTTAVIQIGGYLPSEFSTTLGHLSTIPTYACPTRMSKDLFKFVMKAVAQKETIIFALLGMDQSSKKNFGISKRTFKLIKKLRKQDKKIIIVNFGSPYSLSLFDKDDAIIMAYENDPEAQSAAAKIILGALQPQGKLPVTASEEFVEGLGLSF